IAGLLDILTGCRPLLRPGGILALTARPYWYRGTLVDLPARISQAITEQTDLRLVDRNIALLAAIRGEHLVTRASFFQLDQIRKPRPRGIPRHLTAHEDLLAFQAPRTCPGSEKLNEPRHPHDPPTPAADTSAPQPGVAVAT